MPNENQNPLTMSLLDIKTEFPLLAGGLYELRIAACKVDPVKAPKTGKLINVTLETTQPAVSVTGDQLNAGVKVFDRINLQPSGNSTWEIVGRSVARFVVAAQFDPSGFGHTAMEQIAAADQWAPTLVGRVIKAKVDADPESTKDGRTFPAKNKIAYYLK